MNESKIDCVVIGYNQLPVSDLIHLVEPYKDISATYNHYLVNTVPLNGKRVLYSELLNYGISQATGKPSELDINKIPNLGVCTLASFLRKRGFRAEIVNSFNFEKERLKGLLAESPRSVVITTTFYLYADPIRDIVNFIRDCNPNVKIIAGGPHIFNVCSDNPLENQESDNIFDEMGADVYVFDSQGELALSRICTALRSSRPDLSVIPNLIYRDNSGAYLLSKREIEDNDLDENAVDWRLFEADFLAPTVQTRTARSCAFKCSFCRYPVIAGPLSLVELATLEAELDYLHSIGVSQILFIDDTFNIPEERFQDICRLMIRKKYGFRWFSYFRCANAREETFDLMKESGCTGVFLGIESGDSDVLKAMNKGASVKKYLDGVRRLNERGIISFASFIVGYPTETVASARRTFEFIREAQPSFFCLEYYYHDLKVPIAKKSDEYGIKGAGYSWRHNTMDWKQAVELVDEGYRTLTDSTILPLHGFDLWSIAYLMGEGVSLAQITGFLGSASRIMLENSGDNSGDDSDGGNSSHLAQLVDVFR